MSERDLDDLLLGLRDTANPLDAVAEAESRVLDRLDRTMESRPRALRAAFRSARRTMLALVAVGGVATGATATAAIAIAMPGERSRPMEFLAAPANPENVAFSALAQSTEKPSAYQLSAFRVLERSSPGIRVDDARIIRASDGTQTWVIPGPDRTCFGAENQEGTGTACKSNGSVVRGGLSSAEIGADGIVHAIYLVPDEVISARVGEQTFKPHNNLVVAEYPLGSPVTFTTKSGDTTINTD